VVSISGSAVSEGFYSRVLRLVSRPVVAPKPPPAEPSPAPAVQTAV
jgi:hypothetical protein